MKSSITGDIKSEEYIILRISSKNSGGHMARQRLYWRAQLAVQRTRNADTNRTLRTDNQAPIKVHLAANH
ncbi:MAG: hypothetical protein LBU32_22600 [Clostridiales bacterium]|nr:hypothetical protein [Clostridiales bacterium]